MAKKKVTIKEIAKLAGVSRGTVDRVLNDRGKVEEERKNNILKIAKKLGYKKNIIASNLALNKIRKISVVIPFKDNKYWGIVHQGLNSTSSMLKQHNMNLELFEFNVIEKENYLNQLIAAVNSEPDALLISPVYLQETLKFLDTLKHKKFEIFTFNSELNHDSILSFIGQNSFQAGMIAGKLFAKNITGKAPKILVITLGHHPENAVHIQNKIKGLDNYNTKAKANFDISFINISEFYKTEILKAKCKEIEKLFPKVDGILFTNSRAKPLLQFASYFSAKERTIVNIGFDLTDDNIKLLCDNKVDYLLNERPFQQGRLSLLNIIDHLYYNKEIPQKKYLPIDIVIKENHELYLSTDFK